MKSSDAAWIKAARRLDPETLAQIYVAYSNELYRYAMRLLGDPMRAEDLVAETFSRFLHALHRGGGPKDHLRAYLYRVAHNLAVDRFRQQGTIEGIPENSKSEAPLPEEIVEWSLRSARVRNALWRLTPDQRQVILLKFFQGLRNKEVAVVVEKPVSAVKSLQHRALAALKRALESGDDR